MLDGVTSPEHQPTDAPLATVQYEWTLSTAVKARYLTKTSLPLTILGLSAMYGFIFGHGPVGVLTLGALMFVILNALVIFRLRRTISGIDGTLIADFHEDRFVQRLGDSMNILEWAKFRSARRAGGFWLLAVKPAGAFVIPVAAVAPGDETVIRDLLVRKGLLN
jgi:hypothetical protein